MSKFITVNEIRGLTYSIFGVEKQLATRMIYLNTDDISCFFEDIYTPKNRDEFHLCTSILTKNGIEYKCNNKIDEIKNMIEQDNVFAIPQKEDDNVQ